eukprot:TRINITY_DN40312_c0_g1_i1.p1 TRINITY_DN40312_c0_g1~~TRINITY_DN40312_c0_g1_i1.p1  ORF type:complete len:361 (+),score=89.62 TRINITY_DN40312_c0_g1_i1:92-1174(+)
METKRFLIGLLMVCGVAVSQCGSTQYSQSTQNDYSSVDSPLFMTWFSTLLNLAMAAPAVAMSCTFHGRCSVDTDKLKSCFLGGYFGLTLLEFLTRVAFFYTAWLAANYCYQRALKYISAALVTSLFSTAPAFVAVGSYFALKAPLGALGVTAVLSTIAGSVLVAEPWDDTNSSAMLGGIALSVFAAVAAAAYKVAFKLVFDEPPPEVVGAVLAWVGVYAATVGSALLFVVLASGAETVHWDGVPWSKLLAGALLGLLFNFLIGWGIAYTYPLFISLGTVLNVPLNIGADRVWRDKLPSDSQFGGIGLIIAGFLLLLLNDRLQQRSDGVATYDSCSKSSNQPAGEEEGLVSGRNSEEALAR